MSKFPKWAQKKIAGIIKGHIHDTKGVSINQLYLETASVIRPENLPKALLMQAFRGEAMKEIKGQLKRKLPDNVVGRIKAGLPEEIAQELGSISSWIALSKGPSALWVYTGRAEPKQWFASGRLKREVARSVADSAYRDEDIGRYLEAHCIRCLDDLTMLEPAE